MIEHFHIIAHTVIVVGFFLFIMYARSRQPHVRKLGKSEVRMFQDQIVPGFEHWKHIDQVRVGDLVYTLLKLDLACSDKDRRVLGFSREWVRDQFVRRFPKQRRTTK